MIGVTAHVFGPGPRGRALCAALVEAALPETVVVQFADERAALEAANGVPGRCILVDARLAPEPAAFAAFALGSVRRAVARGFDGAVRSQAAALLVGACSDDADAPIVGDWLDDPEPKASPARGETVEVHSPGFGHGGYASAARNTIVGLHRAGVDVAWRQFYPERNAEIDPDDRELLAAAASNVSRAERALLIQPPTHVTGQLFLDRYVDAYAVTPYACYTMFETDAVPSRWPALLSRANRVWVPSLFNVETFASAGIPRELIEYVPLGLEVERLPVDGERIDVPGRRGFMFLSVFSFTSRKGWDVLIEAWAQAFDANDDVSLVLRTSAGNLDVRTEIGRFVTERGLDPARMAPIVLLEQSLSARALAALYRSSDAFVLPSRGEGVGLPYLEAMAFGLPTVGTGWSGATEFLTDETGYVIASELSLVDRMTARSFPVLRDHHWAAPSIASTAERLREIFERPDETRRRAARGYALARVRYNRTRTGGIAANALERMTPRRRVITAQRATVSYVGPLFSIDGSGASARAAIAALDAQAIPVHARVDGEDQRSALFLDDARIVSAALGRALDPDAPTIVHAGGTRLLRFRGLEQVLGVPEAIDVDRWTPQLGGLSGLGAASSFRFLVTARLNETSGYDIAIGAFLRAFEPGDDAMLTIKVPGGPVDPAQTQSLVAAAARRHAPERAHLLDRYRISIAAGVVPEGDYMQFVGSFDAFVHVPRRPGWSRSLLEAMASALPCIAVPATCEGVPLSEQTGYPASDDAAIVAAMRAIAANVPAAALRGHAARRAIIAQHSLEVVGQMMRDQLEALAATPLALPHEAAAPDGELGIVVDARGIEDCAALVASLPGMTRARHRVIVLHDDQSSLSAAYRDLRDCRFVAYLRGDVVLTQAWDVVLCDALRSRPLLALAVPRIVDAPPPQGLPRPESLADFTRGLTITQVGRGAQPSHVVASCVVLDGGALGAAVGASADVTIESALRAVARGGEAAWCAFDAVVDRSGNRPWPLVELA